MKFMGLPAKLLKRLLFKSDLTSLYRTQPLSRQFGFDRGTPIDRYYIEEFLQTNSDHIKGRVLEIAENNYSKKFSRGKVEAYEVLHASLDNPNASIIGDLTDTSTLPENRIDCFICTQTIHFIYNMKKAIQGAHHLLKPGGVILATFAGISQISRYDMDRWGDYWRVTSLSAKLLFEDVFKGSVIVETYGNVLAAKAFLDGLAIEDLPERKLLDVIDPDYQLIISVVARKES